MEMGDAIPAMIINFHHLLNQLVTWVSENFNISTRKIHLWLSQKNAEILSESGSGIGQTLADTGGLLVVLVLIPVYIFMILFYQQFLLEFLRRIFHSDQHDKVNEVLSATRRIIQSYLTGLFLEALVIGILNCTCLLIVGVDYSILLGVVGAIINIIPYIGGLIAVALPMAMALATGAPTDAIFVLAGYCLIQFLDNHLIIPRLVASKVQLNALISIVAVLAGGMLWGVSGMFLSIPITAIIKVIFDHIEALKPWGYLLGNIVKTESIKTKSLYLNIPGFKNTR
jgi:predicted PurR-regulated permease PerM